jgi:hypothetical protein
MRLPLATFLLVWVITATGADEPKVRRILENGLERFLVQFDLTPDNFVTDVPSLRRPQADGSKSMWRFREGGQFDVLIKRDWFQVQVPESCCNAYLILTMPYTNPKLPGGPENIAAKKKLFDQIDKLSKAEKGTLNVTIDLTAYAEVKSRTPLAVRLKDIQIYFRHADGRYVDHVAELGVKR